jgi:hypothetical protein
VTFLDADAQRGDRILVKFRGKWRFASYVKRDVDGGIVAIIEDDLAEERRFRSTSVRWPTSEEIKAAGLA